MIVLDLVQTCSMCPAQWEGRTTDGRVVYIRYRFGTFSVGVGVTLDDAIDGEVYFEQIGQVLDGWMSTDAMRNIVDALLEY